MSSPAVPAVLGRHRVDGDVTCPVPALSGTTVEDQPEDQRAPLWRRLVAMLTTGALVVGVLAFAFLALGPHLLGYRTATMLTGSMEPGIMPGDVVVTVPAPATELAVGDVISYQIPIENHRVETHRVTEVSTDADGRIQFRTQGDNNPGVDPWTAVVEGDTVWEVRAVVPKIGSAIRVMRVPAVQHGVRWVALAALLLLGMSLIWSRDEEEDDNEDEDTHEDGDEDVDAAVRQAEQAEQADGKGVR